MNILLDSSIGGVFGGLLSFVFAIAISIGIFLLLRNVILWYYKVNIVVKALEEQTEIQRAILEKLERIELAKKQDNNQTQG